MEFSKKYDHVGYSYPAVPKTWVPIVKKAVIAIEKEMWPKYIPLFLKRWIHYLATGNSVVRIRNKFWNKVKNKLTHSMIITDIKDKYATLRIYGYFNDKIHKIIEQAELDCDNTCELWGSRRGVRTVNDCGWYRQACHKCFPKDLLTNLP